MYEKSINNGAKMSPQRPKRYVTTNTIGVKAVYAKLIQQINAFQDFNGVISQIIMLLTNQFIDALEEAISGQFVENVFRKVMLSDVQDDHLEVEPDEKWVKIPTATKLAVLTKALVNDRISVSACIEYN